MHWHHIIPRHAGGTDNPDNLVQLTIEEHAEAHRTLYEQYGCWQDRVAWQMLSGRILPEEARIEAAKQGYQDWKKENPELYQEKLKKNHEFLIDRYGKKTTINGVTYRTRNEAGRALGITDVQARRNAEYEARGFPPCPGFNKRVVIPDDGTIHNSIKEAAVHLEMGYSTLRKHIRAGKIEVHELTKAGG